MNIFQRIILVVGAAALLVMLSLIGAYQHGGGGAIFTSNSQRDYANIWDWQSALVRGAIISTATVAVYLAVGKKK